MNILVCVKQVPDNAVVPTLDPATNRVVTQGVETMVSPFDLNAVEAGLKLAEEHGGEVTVLSLGDDSCKTSLRIALSMGAAKAYLVSDPALEDSDSFAVSYTLAKAIQHIGQFDVILCGKQAIDGDTGQTAPSIAEHLGATRLTYVLSLKVEGDKVIAERQVEEGVEVIETKFPVLCTATKESNKPRYATVKGVMRSFNTEIGQITLADLPDADTTKMGLKGSPTKVKATFTPKRTANCVNIEGVSPVEIADNLIGKLVEAKEL